MKMQHAHFSNFKADAGLQGLFSIHKITQFLVKSLNTDLRSGLAASDTLLERPRPPYSASSSSPSSLSSSLLRFTRTTELTTGALRFRDNSSCQTETLN